MRRDSRTLSTDQLQYMIMMSQFPVDIREEMESRTGKPGFANKASAAECCCVIMEEIENHVG
jgi:hypothetical protein